MLAERRGERWDGAYRSSREKGRLYMRSVRVQGLRILHKHRMNERVFGGMHCYSADWSLSDSVLAIHFCKRICYRE
jgi:hypothetical protein